MEASAAKRPKLEKNNFSSRRDRTGRGSGMADKDITDDSGCDDPTQPRRPKRKVALLMSYCGTNYQGMQMYGIRSLNFINDQYRNPGAITIESVLFEALCKAGAVSKDNSNDLKKVKFMRAARTDKGVHAGGQVVSLKMIIDDADIVSNINQHLPNDIRLWGNFVCQISVLILLGYVRVINSFSAKTLCGT